MSAHLLLLFIFFVFFTSPPPTLPQCSRAFQIPHFPFLPLSPFPPDHPFPSNHSSNSPSILQSSLKLTSPSGEGQGASLPSVVHFDARIALLRRLMVFGTFTFISNFTPSSPFRRFFHGCSDDRELNLVRQRCGPVSSGLGDRRARQTFSSSPP